MKKRTSRALAAAAMLGLSLLLDAVLVASRIHRFSDTVWQLELVAGCELDYHIPPVNAVALACPGVDLMRIWPLPITQPWCETPEPYEELAWARHPNLLTPTEVDRLQLVQSRTIRNHR